MFHIKNGTFKYRLKSSKCLWSNVNDVSFQRFRSPICPVYPSGSMRGQHGGCWPTVAPHGSTPLRYCDEPVAAAVQSFTAWRQNLLAISAAAAAAGATHHGRAGLEHHGTPATSVIDGPLSLRFDHCRLPAALLMSQHDVSDLNSCTGLWLPSLTLWRPMLPYTLALSPERKSARMSKITNDSLTRSGILYSCTYGKGVKRLMTIWHLFCKMLSVVVKI